MCIYTLSCNCEPLLVARVRLFTSSVSVRSGFQVSRTNYTAFSGSLGGVCRDFSVLFRCQGHCFVSDGFLAAADRVLSSSSSSNEDSASSFVADLTEDPSMAEISLSRRDPSESARFLSQLLDTCRLRRNSCRTCCLSSSLFAGAKGLVTRQNFRYS